MMVKNRNVSNNITSMDTSGWRLARAIEAKGYTRADVCRKSGISYDTLSRMIQGELIGSISSWAIVCSSLGISLDEVIGICTEEVDDGR